jgi:hypothetical protein
MNRIDGMEARIEVTSGGLKRRGGYWMDVDKRVRTCIRSFARRDILRKI